VWPFFWQGQRMRPDAALLIARTGRACFDRLNLTLCSMIGGGRTPTGTSDELGKYLVRAIQRPTTNITVAYNRKNYVFVPATNQQL